MKNKTEVKAEEGKQEVTITRLFELPLDLLFKAYTEAEFLEQWMGTSVKKLECKPHGSYRFETTDPKGNVHGFNGTIHELSKNRQIIRTFEMENTPFPVQLEFLEFEKVDDENSRLRIRIVYRSVEDRDRMLQLPFRQGINMAHNALESIMKSKK